LEIALTPEVIENDDIMYHQALQSTDNDPWLHYNYGIFLKEQKKPEAATIQIERFTNLLPLSYKGHHELAVMLAGSGRFEEALSHYQTAISLIRITETRTELRLLYAYALARLGRYEESMAIYEEALAEDPSSAVNLYHAMAKLRLKTGPLTEALELLEKAIVANNEAGEIPDIYFNYGHVLKQLKKRDQSVAAYKEAIKTYEKELETADEGDKETLLVVSGRSYFETGEIDKGSRYLQQAIQRDPAKLDYHLTLITALARNGRQMEALKFTDQALVTMTESSRPDAIAKLNGIKSQIAKR
jgi:tetratricopeptide (TPR) repeat protein